MYSRLHNLYWCIRWYRNSSTKRKYYRYVAKEKKRLIESGVDREEIRLLCRHLANPKNRVSENRLITYRKNQKVNLISF